MKIAEIQQSGTWESQYGLMYRMEVTLEDKRAGEVNAKKPDAWKVGDEVEIVDAKPNPRGLTKWKLQRPEQKSFGASPDTQRRIDASWSVGQAIALGSRTPEDIESTAIGLLELRDKIASR